MGYARFTKDKERHNVMDPKNRPLDKIHRDVLFSFKKGSVNQRTVSENWSPSSRNGLVKKKVVEVPMDKRKKWIEADNLELSISKQCLLAAIPKGTFYYSKVDVSREDVEVMHFIDKQYADTPYYGSRRMEALLKRNGYQVNRKRVRRLMKVMGLEAIYPGPNTSKRNHEHKVYPYLLKGVSIGKINQVWSTDITYIRMVNGFMYLTAVMDWYSRYVLSWRLSNCLNIDFCLEALSTGGCPEIFNTDQGCQFTSSAFVDKVLGRGCKMSMDGRGRALDNVFIERLWRSLKYEEVYLKEYESVSDARKGIGDYLRNYNDKRPHQSLNYRFPKEVYYTL